MGSYYKILFILLIAPCAGRAQEPSLTQQSASPARQPAPPATQLAPPGQQSAPPATLSVEKIMQDPKWIGISPSQPYWSANGKYLFFQWNPERAPSDSLYYITPEDPSPRKAPYSLQQSMPSADRVHYNSTRTAYTYEKDGDIFWVDSRNGLEKRITATLAIEHDPQYSFHDTRIVYIKNNDLFSWDPATGLNAQLTNFQPSAAPATLPPPDAQEKWLQEDQLRYFSVLRDRKRKKDLADAINKANKPRTLKAIYLDDKKLTELEISPDGRFITYNLLTAPAGAKATFVPSFVTESGFTRELPGRTKVGAPPGSYSFFIFDQEQDTILALPTDQIPGITDLPDYLKDYPATKGHQKDTATNKPPPRALLFNGPYWSQQGSHAVLDIRSRDHKDRWLMLLDPVTGKLHLLDRQRDEAWIAGPGIGDGEDFNKGNTGWIDENTFWYQSEASGYSHLYKVDVGTGEKTQLTPGTYEVLDATLSGNKKYFYITTNASDPGQQQYYRLPVAGGAAEQLTRIKGANIVTPSPDEQQLAILNSYSNRPWELYLQDNKTPDASANSLRTTASNSGRAANAAGAPARPRQITTMAMSAAFRAYPWRDPEIITFRARDGATVRARIYRPAAASLSPAIPSAGTNTAAATASATIPPASAAIPPASTAAAASHPGVIFVHGAGYLQNAHKWWSYYFHEFMFNNLLADNGYTVLDIDYRGSAGYGRDWRTGIYRHMGGKDLSDQVDGARWLAEHEGVDPKRIGIYGGSYGGFITLMALFTEPHPFAAGAALRSVTDWAHYNHEYTSNILNEPFTDSIAYRQSSPLYFAEGFKGHLLMCHGMIDENVHFQDIVRLTQRLIELGKDNWELAAYPLEDHSFVEPSSWTDEYKRIYKLFNTYLKDAVP